MKSKKMTEGFTLVELIVVIAILGILAGVGTVGYSGYIKKANMAADQQLVSSVANALTLQSYACYESVVKYMDDSTLNTAFNNMNAAFETASSKDEVLLAMAAMNTAITNYTNANLGQDTEAGKKWMHILAARLMMQKHSLLLWVQCPA